MKLNILNTLILFLTIWKIQSRVFQTSFKFSHFGKNNGWVYLDKMTFAPGTVQYSIRTTPNGIPYSSGGQVVVQAIPQYHWQDELQRKCQDIPKQPYTKHRISVAQSSIDYSRKTFALQETTLYYFVLKDCNNQLKGDYENNNLSLNIRLHMLNNGRQLGQEEDHWYIVVVVAIAGIWLVYFYNGKMKGTDLKTNWHKLIMFAGIATQISSLVWKTVGFLIYTFTGSDYMFFHLIYLFMHSMSESLVIGLITLIGFGWTINFQSTKDLDLYMPLLGCLAFFNAVLTLLTRISTSQHDMHHIFDNISGHIIIGYRILIAVIFFIGIINTYQKSRARVKSFINIFGLLGGLYICALPLIIWIGNVFIPAKDRHQFVFVAMQTLKCSTNIGLSIMLNYEKSSYNEITYDKKSFLPQESKYF